ECGKKLSSNKSLKNHIRIHSGEKSFSCPYCNSSFRAIFNRHRHIRLVHKIQHYVCLTCEKQFDLKSWLREHLIINKGHIGTEQVSNYNIMSRA
ncbi:hypothetical protein PMAYCL1PPCAC_27878, partial [Pristionchus mayeri]